MVGWYVDDDVPLSNNYVPMVLFEIKSQTTTYLKIEIRHRRDKGGPTSISPDVTLWAIWLPEGSATTKEQELVRTDKLNPIIRSVDWSYIYIVFGKQAVGTDTSVVQRQIDVYLGCNLLGRYEMGVEPIAVPPSGTTVSICGFDEYDCQNLFIQDYFFSQRGFLSIVSRKYCPGSTCKIDCNEDGLRIRQETEVEISKSIDLSSRLADCQDKLSPPLGQYCILADGSRIRVGAEVKESPTLTCRCLAALSLSCTVDSDKPDCSKYENTRLIRPQGYTKDVCEAEYCSGGTVYKTEGMVCTKVASCQNREGENCILRPEANCYCPDNQIYDNEDSRKCVWSFQCPCIHKGKEIEHSSMELFGDEVCLCRSGKVKCLPSSLFTFQ